MTIVDHLRFFTLFTAIAVVAFSAASLILV
jgi:hypothetical protein